MRRRNRHPAIDASTASGYDSSNELIAKAPRIEAGPESDPSNRPAEQPDRAQMARRMLLLPRESKAHGWIEPRVTRILVLYLSVGTGHQSAARSIRSAFGQLAPGVEVLCLDPLAQVWEGFPNLLSTLSAVPLFVAPQLYDRLWREGEDHGLMSRLVGTDLSQSAVRSAIDRFKPSAVICTHAFPARVLTAMPETRRRPLPPVYAVPTDFGLHAFWPTHGVRRYFVANEGQRDDLIGRGVSASRVTVSGIPISLKGRGDSSPSFLRGRLRMRPNLPLVLLVAGGLHSGPYAAAQLQLLSVLQEFNRAGHRLQLAVVCGRNGFLRRYLRNRTAKFDVPTRILGYVEELPSLMKMASVLVTKPGGLTAAEALASGLPMVLLRAGPGQEEANARFLSEAGAALVTESPDDVVASVSEVLTHPEQLARMRARALALGRPDAAWVVASEVLAGLGRSRVLAQSIQP